MQPTQRTQSGDREAPSVPSVFPVGNIIIHKTPHLCPPLPHVVVTDEPAETAAWAPSGPVRAIQTGGVPVRSSGVPGRDPGDDTGFNRV